MSELKAYRVKGVTLGDTHDVYLKSEADKVIAEKDETIDELKERNDELQKATDSAWSKVNAMYDELSHHKYKRCLAMAWWCESEEKHLDAIAPLFETAKECWEYNSDYWVKWHKRWLAIAEKFKTNSTAK